MEQTAQTLLLRAIFDVLSQEQRSAVTSMLERWARESEDRSIQQACSTAQHIATGRGE